MFLYGMVFRSIKPELVYQSKANTKVFRSINSNFAKCWKLVKEFLFL